ncbi:tyrosine-type recombinase/integrase [Sulfurirhabdus autotrophica]|uniref:Integrase n=1 Tax=Sulfurirhabdus autotrophica TaxID=1706046 RepID=A0A4R3Y4Y8_9PROT|nr:tyrosine-type recombinase/integrase [Sulfurirhabdus autotrophica]TCV85868.1 integrase [Sulfurirhabdus autotrophica]
MPLTDIATRKAKPRASQYKLGAGNSLYLLVHPNGSKYWRMKYRFNGKEKTLSFGQYPEISLDKARELAADAKKSIKASIDPMAKSTHSTFESVANEWHDSKALPGTNAKATKWAPVTAGKIKAMLENHLYPHIGKRPIAEIDSDELLTTLQKIESDGKHETANRALQVCGQIFRYAVRKKKTSSDLSVLIRGDLIQTKEKNHAAIKDPKKLGELLRKLENYQGYSTKCALKLIAMLFVRPGELRHAEWAEFDLDASEWRIPDHKMKMKTMHLVPLSTQAVTIIRELQALTGDSNYLFPAISNNDKPMSENTLNNALRRLGYDTQADICAHGFRGTASTILHEQGWPHEAIERQLAHIEGNKVSKAYNHSQHLPKRKEMMQAWSDYLEGLAAGGEVVNIRAA